MTATAISLKDRQQKFLELLPAIDSQARMAFRCERAERRHELTAEVIANCWVAFVRLMERNLESIIYPTPLALYAIKQVRIGRYVGTKLNVRDITSEYCQHKKGVVVESLEYFDEDKGEWQEMIVEDRHSTPADIASTRIDFNSWLATLPKRDRTIAESLALGESNGSAAKLFGVSFGRISQIRRDLKVAWDQFHEPAVAALATA
jgi:hypothetical protein